MNSIEWLYKLSKERELDKFDLEQAQAMHHQEITDAYNKGYLNIKLGDYDAAEKYFKETFKTTKDGFVYLTDAPLMFNKKRKKD
jgi:hypothetical protein